jgi:hypothetical protein
MNLGATSEAALQPKIRWKASGPALCNRDGTVDKAGTIHVVRQGNGRYTVKHAGKVRAEGLEDVEAAKRWAGGHVATWVAEASAARKAEEEETARTFAEERARQERRKRVAADLQALGVCARAEAGRIVLDTYVAEDLLERLRPRPEVQP